MKIASFAMLASLLIAGCVATTPPDILPAFNPADPAMGVRDTHYHPAVVDYRHREPVDPQNWRRLNEERSSANPRAGS
ncbi:hypothetical protein [Mesorhizobium sp.]|uniref:hypothetical protein n=1 Tax=Mesorhizobium sp. TaxID=1871066 RepID=UPI00122BFB88|nr:hypothetical protein [Mesorhizobium sp.]TIN09048.1 MAG: hypothetical protein E5Y14_17695 [Mesorhizobium sp.]